MEQMDPPPDTALALNAPRPLHPTVPATVLPYPRLERWGFLHYPADVSIRDFTQILGIQYSLADLIELANDLTPEDQLPDNSDGTVIRLLRMNPADRRMQYRYYLESAARIAGRKQSPDYPYLMSEQLHWVDRDLDEMNAKLGPPSGGLPYSIDVLRTDPGACWTWTMPLDPGRKYPTTASWRGMQHITVHRLLWPIMWPDEPYRARPARVCENDLCVNPRHFVDPSKRARREQQGPGKGHTRKDGYKTANTIPYYGEHVLALGDGRFELRCPRCHAPASDYYQAIVNRSIAQGWWGNIHGKMGTMNCRPCHELYMAHRNAETRALRASNPKRGLTEAERFDLKFKEGQQEQGRELWGDESDNWHTHEIGPADTA